MPQAQITQALLFEDSGASLMARVRGQDAVNIVQAALSAIVYTVIDKTTQAIVVASTALVISSVVFNALQTDARWTKDATGYNFRHDIAASAFPSGDSTYRVEYKFTPVSGAVFHVVYEINTINLMGS